MNNLINHNEKDYNSWAQEEKKLQKKIIWSIILIFISAILFALILCDIFGVFGEKSIIVKIITGITTFVAFIKGIHDLIGSYIFYKRNSNNTKDK